MKVFSFIKVQSAHNLCWTWPQLGQGCNVTGCTHAAKITWQNNGIILDLSSLIANRTRRPAASAAGAAQLE